MPDLRKQLRALLYGRVSHDRHGESKSVNQQLALGRGWAAREQHRVVGEYRDDNVSASKYARKQRDDWPLVMEEIVAGEVDVLWVWEISRTTRDRPVWAALLAACESNNVLIAVDGRMHDPNDPDDGFLLDLSAMLGIRESKVTSKRIRRDVVARAAAGRPHGRLAYGYRRDYVVKADGTRVLDAQVPDPIVAPLILEAAKRFVDGDALYKIAADFTRRGVPRPVEVRAERLERPTPAPGSWDPNQVRRLIASPTNAGIRSHKGMEIDTEAWEPIIPLDLHRRVAAKLADPKRRTNNDSLTKHLLVAIARCAECDAVVRKINNRGVPSYSCSAGFHVSRAMHFVDDYVTEVLLSLLARPDVADLLAERADDDAVGARARAAAEADEQQHVLDGWVQAAIEGKVSPESFASIEAGLRARIDEARQRAAPPVPSSAAVSTLVDAHDVRTVWEEFPVTTRREVIRELMVIRIHRTRRGVRHLDPDSIEITWTFGEGF